MDSPQSRSEWPLGTVARSRRRADAKPATHHLSCPSRQRYDALLTRLPSSIRPCAMFPSDVDSGGRSGRSAIDDRSFIPVAPPQAYSDPPGQVSVPGTAAQPPWATTPAPTSSMSTSAPCARSSAQPETRRCPEWETDSKGRLMKSVTRLARASPAMGVTATWIDDCPTGSLPRENGTGRDRHRAHRPPPSPVPVGRHPHHNRRRAGRHGKHR